MDSVAMMAAIDPARLSADSGMEEAPVPMPFLRQAPPVLSAGPPMGMMAPPAKMSVVVGP